MHLSSRVSALKPSSTLAVTARAKELRADGVDILSFAAGEPDFDTPDPIKKAAIDALNKGMTKYGPVPGDLDCRTAIADKLAAENAIPGVTPDNVVVSSGGKHTLYNLFQALLDPPGPRHITGQVIVPVPAWVSYAPQIQLAGGAVVEIPTTAESNFKMSVEQLRAAVTPSTRALVLNSPSNPCGTMYSPDELRAIAETVAELARSTAPDLVIVSDEIYEKIIYGPDEHLSIGSLPEVSERTVTVNGLSKAYSMTGWRIGYFAAPGEFGRQLAAGVRKLQSQSTTSIPTFLMPAIRVALNDCHDEVEAMRQAFARRAKLMYDGVSSIPGVVCPEPTGAFYVFPDLSEHFGKTSKGGQVINAAADFAAALLEESHVAVVPGEDFGAGAERCCRLSFACADDDISRGIERLGEFVAGLH